MLHDLIWFAKRLSGCSVENRLEGESGDAGQEGAIARAILEMMVVGTESMTQGGEGSEQIPT